MPAKSMNYSELREAVFELYGQGKLAEALQLLEDNAGGLRERAALIAFWRMCLHSLLGKPEAVMAVFREALAAGHWWHESNFLDSDMDAVRDLPEFRKLVGLSHKKYLQVRDSLKPERQVLVPDQSAGSFPLLVALHGRRANAETDLGRWEAARQRGWLVLLPQSSQPLSDYSFIWDDSARGLQDIGFHYEEILREYPVDPQRIVLAGFSQGSGLALTAALQKTVPARGFIGVASWHEKPEDLAASARQRKDLRAYFITGKKEPTPEISRRIQSVLRESGTPVGEEVHTDIGHEFPADFEASFEKAIAFIFEEEE